MKKNVVLPLLLFACIAAGAWLWNDHQQSTTKIHYLTETVSRGTIRKTINATGQVDAVQLVAVGSQVSGKIIMLNAAIGQQVKKGELIAQIDPTTKENDLKTAKAKLETYEAQLESSKIALKIAQTKYRRELMLRKKEATSQANLEDAENSLAAAKAHVKEIESQILQQQIAVNSAETNLSYTKIAAPLDGTIVSVPVKEGQTVNANQTAPTIAQIADFSHMEIKIEVSEGDIPFIKKGMHVRYSLLSDPDRIYHAEISAIDPGSTAMSDATGTSTSASSASSSSAVYYYAKARVANPDNVLRLNMTTQNIIEIEHAENVLMLPSLVIHNNGKGKRSVRVLHSDNSVEVREVETGLSNNVMTEIRSGLTEGEKVIATQMSASELQSRLANPRSGRR